MNPRVKFLTTVSIAVFFMLGLVGLLRIFDNPSFECVPKPKTDSKSDSKSDSTSSTKRMKSSFNSSSSSSSSSSSTSACAKTAILCHRNMHLHEEQTTSRFLSTLSLDSLKFLLHGMLSSLEYKCETKKGFGTSGLGAYEICMVANIQPKSGDCLVYSFGISNDWSFDEQMAKFGCEVHSFDPSIGKEDHEHQPNVTFHNVGLWGSDIVNSNGWKLEKLSTIRKRLGHEQRVIDILKVDIEGGEWPFLRNVLYEDQDQLSTVKQLLMELHAPRFKLETVTKKDYREMITYLTDLRRSEFQTFKNFHDGNCCGAFASLMPPEIPERCCEEVAMVNLRFL